jgi:hypothetical protein
MRGIGWHEADEGGDCGSIVLSSGVSRPSGGRQGQHGLQGRIGAPAGSETVVRSREPRACLAARETGGKDGGAPPLGPAAAVVHRLGGSMDVMRDTPGTACNARVARGPGGVRGVGGDTGECGPARSGRGSRPAPIR